MNERPTRYKHVIPSGVLGQERRCKLCGGSYIVTDMHISGPIDGHWKIESRCHRCGGLNPLTDVTVEDD